MLEKKKNIRMKSKVVVVDGENYVPALMYPRLAAQVDGADYCIIRTRSAGVFAGYLTQRSGMEGHVREARRIWQWRGAASLSQLAVDGTSLPGSCKFPCPVEKIILTEIIEIIPATEKARISIQEVPVWKV